MYEITIMLLAVAAFISAVRLFLGPTLSDRVISIDAISSIVVAAIVLISMVFSNRMLIDIAIVYAMLSFVGTLAISKYIMGKKMSEA
ncbi:MAG: cation:proton antiporter [Candidatus Aenigmarchaeota archaeon]|nr:cation:proton antiporter [Candidatus Aenigmarchaeota archaeon]